MVCITEPITPTAVVKGPSRDANTFFKDICSNNNVRYIDFTLLKNDVFDITDNDFCDWEGHMYGEAAERFSGIMSEVLANGNEEYFYDSYKAKIDEIERKSLEIFKDSAFYGSDCRHDSYNGLCTCSIRVYKVYNSRD